MSRYERIKGLPIISVAEGRELGKVEELLLNPVHKFVCWLRLHTGGLFGERRYVSVGSIHGLGEHAVTIGSEADIRSRDDIPNFESMIEAGRGLMNVQVVTQSGKRLGKVGDFEFAPDTFALTQLLVPPGMNILGQFMLIPADRVMTVGADAIVTTDDALARQVSQPKAEEPALTRQAPQPKTKEPALAREPA